MAKNTDLPFIELLLTTPADDFLLLSTEMFASVLPRLILNVFRDRDPSEMIDWIDRMVDRISDKECISHRSLVPSRWRLRPVISTSNAIDVHANQLKKRADVRYDLLSESLLFELKMLSAQNIEAIATIVRECFDREQIDDHNIDFEWWKNVSSLVESSR